MRITKILKNEDDFDTLLEMLVQEAESEKMEPIFDPEEPTSYPCLVVVTEIQNTDMDIMLELEDDEEPTDEQIDEAMENMQFGMTEQIIYEFLFITQKDIKELLEV